MTIPELPRPATLRDQLGLARIRYYAVSAPEGVHFVAARSPREAQALVFDAIKDTLRGDTEHPEPWVMTELHPRLATPEDLHAGKALRLLPPHPPAIPRLLDSPIAEIRHPRPARALHSGRHLCPSTQPSSLRSAGYSL